jgi:tetratricopeptide (TPR) repeat protein
LLGSALSLQGTGLYVKGKPDESKGKFDESVAVYREVIRRKPDYAEAHHYLGSVLTSQGKIDEAIAECREAIRLKPDVAEFHVTLALALNGQKKNEEAIAEIRRAQRLDPVYPEAHCSLGMILYQSGDYAGAEAELRAGQELRCGRAGLPCFSTDLIAGVHKMALAARLPAVVNGQDRPKDGPEWATFGEIAYDRKQFAAAARLWARALEADSKLGDDRKAQHRYNAACAAALTAAGQDEQNKSLDASARAKLRRQALAWLQSELDAWAKVLDSGKPEDRRTIANVLKHWGEDADLAGVRDAAALDALPADEQKAFRALWSQVDAILVRAWAAAGSKR